MVCIDSAMGVSRFLAGAGGFFVSVKSFLVGRGVDFLSCFFVLVGGVFLLVAMSAESVEDGRFFALSVIQTFILLAKTPGNPHGC